MKPHHPLPRKKPVAGPSLLERMNPNAAGIDCGAETHYVAVPPDRDATPVRAFTTFTRGSLFGTGQPVTRLSRYRRSPPDAS